MDRRCRVSSALAGQRLDQALAELLPDLGLRGRRRRIAQGRILINGRLRPAACRLRVDDEILLLEDAAEPAVHSDSDIDRAQRTQGAPEDRVAPVRPPFRRICPGSWPGRASIAFCTNPPGCTAQPWPGATDPAWRPVCRASCLERRPKRAFCNVSITALRASSARR